MRRLLTRHAPTPTQLLPCEEDIQEHLVHYKKQRVRHMKPVPRLRYYTTGMETTFILNRVCFVRLSRERERAKLKHLSTQAKRRRPHAFDCESQVDVQ